MYTEMQNSNSPFIAGIISGQLSKTRFPFLVNSMNLAPVEWTVNNGTSVRAKPNFWPSGLRGNTLARIAAFSAEKYTYTCFFPDPFCRPFGGSFIIHSPHGRLYPIIVAASWWTHANGHLSVPSNFHKINSIEVAYIRGRIFTCARTFVTTSGCVSWNTTRWWHRTKRFLWHMTTPARSLLIPDVVGLIRGATWIFCLVWKKKNCKK